MKKIDRNNILLCVGAVCILLALALAGYNALRQQRGAQQVQQGAAALARALPTEPQTPELYRLEPELPMPTLELDGQHYLGLLELPTLGLELPVLADCSDTLLEYGPCRYAGSAYSGGLVVAGHNYRAVFGPLKQLEPGAPVQFTDTDGHVFHYTVAALEELPGTAVEKMQSGDCPLTLFTCTYGGQNRLTVRCSAAQQERCAVHPVQPKHPRIKPCEPPQQSYALLWGFLCLTGVFNIVRPLCQHQSGARLQQAPLWLV